MADGSGKLQWVTLFDNMNAKAEAKEEKNEKKKSKPKPKAEDAADMPHLPKTPPKGEGKGKKRMSVERIYQKKSQLEHILLRPDTYIGSVEKVTQPMWVINEEADRMIQRDLTFVPGLYKIFDEILVNAADNKQRDPKMTTIKIDIDSENNRVKIWNNGKGIPVIEHKTEKVMVPTLIFGHLLTSSNYNDEEQKVTGGRNGYGAKLCNIFSNKFVVETSSKDEGHAFKQTWTHNMGKATEAKITPCASEDYTCITFEPDLAKFKMDSLDKDIVDLFSRRAYDIAASTKGVKVFLNGKKLPINSFRSYVDLFLKDKFDDNGQPLNVVHEVINPRWEVAVTLSDSGFKQASFVNSIATTKGGRHIDYFVDQVVNKLADVVKKKQGKGGMAVKPFQIKNHMWVFVNCLIVNPTFDSQTKENMTLQAKSFGSKCELNDKFIQQVSKCGIVESILSWVKFKTQTQLNKKCHASKHSKLKGIPKLDDANDAGTKNSAHCTLILTEGDSAKTLAVAGLSVIGRDQYGVFPLRGKVLNVREATHKQIMENAEINNLIKIVGLQYKNKYDSPETLKTLRYGKIMIMTDQDQDGSHIKGLLVNFIHHNWPSLLKHNFVEEFITPIVKVTKGKEEKAFYSLPEFEEWKEATPNWHTYRCKYYKGLGTSTSKEAKEYFSDMERHRIPFKYSGPSDDASITLAFSKKKIEERKQWLSNFMEDRKRRAELGLPDVYLYGKDTRHITYNDFINKELILFSNMDNERSIPSLIDGFKPGQRKVMFTCLKRNLQKEIKVAQLAGSVSEMSAYHHGEMSLMGTIINLAQNFVGSNNLNLLQPIGQFGTRLHGGKDAASPRYIFTALSPLARAVFNAHDEPLYKYCYDDNLKVEPQFYVPILPMVLVNGAEGIGTGWSTKIPNYDIREIVSNLKRLIDGEEPRPMIPAFKNFIGTIEDHSGETICHGEVSILDDETIEITELPIRVWTQNYKESVLEPMLQGTDKTPAVISDYKEYHTDVTVKFVVKMTAEKLAQAEQVGLHKFFKLQTSISSNMVLFDKNGCLKKYDRAEDVLREFYDVRMEYYIKRKDYLEGLLSAEALKLENQARFICEKIDGEISIENKPKKELIQLLVRRGYDSDPLKAWREAQDKLAEADRGGVETESDDEQSEASSTAGGPDFNYILNLPLWSLSKEKKEELLKQRDAKQEELRALRRKTPSCLWKDDLEKFLEELEKVEQKEREDAAAGVNPGVVKTAKGRAKPKKIHIEETKPSPMGRRVEPRIDQALRSKLERKKGKGGKGDDPTQKRLFDFLDAEDGNDIKSVAASETTSKADDEFDEPKSLADRLGKKIGSSQGSSTAAPKAKRQAKPKKSPAKGKKGKKKKGPWESSDDESDVNMEESDNDDFDFGPRERAEPRRATAKATFKFNDDSEDEVAKIDDDSDQSFKFDDEEDEPKPKKVKPPKKSVRIAMSDDEDEEFNDVQESQEEKVMAVISDSEDEPLVVEKEPPKPKEAPKKKTLGKKTVPLGTKDSKQPSIFAKLSTIPKSSDVDVASVSSTASSGLFGARNSQLSSAPSSSQNLDDIIEVESISSVASSATAACPPGKKEKAPKKSKPKKKATSDGDSEDDMPKKPKKSVAAKKRPKKTVSSDDSADEFCPKKKKSTAAKKKKVDNEDMEGMDLNNIIPKERSQRARKAVTYNFDDDDDDSDF
ncbi:LOW QUALITY PROTEIN: DNA topoisomerase 2-alpha-like [Lingula anatina]|uniref:DNA topoisomerase 2 n=1 Tax=Lingula anatina TaxID=7574 RepID=A0A2R2MQU0_LINAN|nr:LOW QUALITY PROTEIN: DNA topoisomerase 2-alpha-like [Lingula anatina]|eukprot:XP_023932528.1 LOW QUALITY PROTEIN: DNA topoisomerase 2-alpha-like [Lingula anatina]